MTATIVAVDGPAAAGKGTLARRLAAELGLPFLDTGLLYRATGRRLLDAGADPRDARAAEAAGAMAAGLVAGCSHDNRACQGHGLLGGQHRWCLKRSALLACSGCCHLK